MTVFRSTPGAIAASLVLVLGTLQPSVAAQTPQQFLDRLVGEWRGTGFLVRRAGGAQETAVCRLATARAADGIRNSGRCAASSAGGDVEGRLRYDAERGAFFGSFLDPEAQEMKPAVGRLANETLTLRRTESREGGIVRVIATLRMQGAHRYRVEVTEVSTGTSRTVLRLTFVRQ